LPGAQRWRRRTEQIAMLTQSIAQGLKHSVLVTHPMSEGAMTRLKTFFDVETRLEDRVPSSDELVGWLRGKAGVIADTRFVFDAQVVRRLPVLKAICNLDAEHHNLDLQALTNAGIRATSTPALGSAQLSVEASADRAWQVLRPLLQRAVPVPGAQGRYSGKWSRQVQLAAPVHMLSVAVMGDGPFAQALAALAKAALVLLARPGVDAARPVSVSASLGADRLAIWRTADVVVVCGPGAGSPPPICITAADMALMKPSARILNLAGPAALAADILRNTVLLARIEHSEVVLADEIAERDQLLLNRTRVAAEDLIASLGFGRNSWHPPHLLNTDILCESCC
jgi:gluconate 2-dehydrogenase